MSTFMDSQNFPSQWRALTASDRQILNSVRSLLPGIALVFGPGCAVVLRSAEDASFPCIAVENGEIADATIGCPASEFVADVLTDEAHHGGKNTVGVYYTKSVEDHALKCVVNIIRNEMQDLIGCLSIAIDVSVPLHEFVRNFIPVVDNDLADSIAEPTAGTAIESVDDMVHKAIEQAIATANGYRAISPTERNKLIVRELQNYGIFSIRSAVNFVAKELGVSRYTIYNYLKDTSMNSKD